MKKFTNHLTALTLAGLMVLTTASVGAASVYRSVTAKQNTTATVKVNGVNLTLKEDDDSLYPLTYDGVTYLPAKQLADALGYNASVNDGSVTITSKTTSTTTSSSGDIGAEKAKQIALEHAGHPKFPLSKPKQIMMMAERFMTLSFIPATKNTTTKSLLPMAPSFLWTMM